MARLLALVLLVLIALLQLKYWAGPGGVREVEALRARVAEQKKENAALLERNEALEAEVEDLRAGKSALEERARAELGMIKPGETFYRVIEPQKPSVPEHAP
jgi:cell division protein FtsB